jgi:DNA-binding IclR family transcriptional regulator
MVRRGWPEDNAEFEEVVKRTVVPAGDHHGLVCHSLSLTALKAPEALKTLRQKVPLLTAAAAVSKEYGWTAEHA